MRVGVAIWWMKHPNKYQRVFHLLMDLCTKVCLSPTAPPTMPLNIKRSSKVKRSKNFFEMHRTAIPFYHSISSHGER